MPRPQRPLDPAAGPRERFALELRDLRSAAGTPSYEQMANLVHYSRTALSEAAGGRSFPSWDVTHAFVQACGGDEHQWERRWAAAETALRAAQDPAGSLPQAGIVVASRPQDADRLHQQAADRPRPQDADRLHQQAADRPRPQDAGRRRQRTSRWAVVTSALMLVIGVVIGTQLPHDTDRPAHSVFLGGADLAGYCRSGGFAGISLDGPTAYDWHCVRPPLVRRGLSVIMACRWQYHDSFALARFADFRNPASWQCWDHVIVLGRVDLQKYCQSRSYSGPALEGPAVMDWHCVSATGRQEVIDEDSACRWQYGSRVVTIAVGTVHAPWEQWDCWG